MSAASLRSPCQSFWLSLRPNKRARSCGLGHPIDVPRIVAILQGLGLIAIGNILPKQGSSSHAAIGKRNEARNQYRVSKLIGILYMVTGAGLFVAAMTAASPKWLFALNLGGVVVAATSGLLYACLLSKLGPTRS